MDTDLYEYMGWFLLSIVKFVLTPSSMIAAGYSWTVTILTIGISSSIGFSAFYFFGDTIFTKLDSLRKKPKKTFSTMNRRLVKIKTQYGLAGLGLVAGILSVPLAGLITAKFFHDDRKAIPSIVLAFWIWTFVLTSVSWLVRNMFSGDV